MNIAPYYKAVLAGLSMAGMAVTGIVSLMALVPTDNAVAGTVVGVGMAVLAVTGTVSTYLIKNEATIEAVADEGGDAAKAIWDELRNLKDRQARTQAPIVEPYKAVAPAAQPVANIPAPQPDPLPAPAPVPAVEDVAAVLARMKVS